MGRRTAIVGVALAAAAVLVFLAWSTRDVSDPGLGVVRAAAPVTPRPRPEPPPPRREEGGAPAGEVAVVPASAPRAELPARSERGAEGPAPEPTATVSLTVTAAPPPDAEGAAKVAARPLRGVRIAAYQPGEPRVTRPVDAAKGDLERSPRTDDQGRATLSLPPGVELRIVARGEDLGVADRSLVVAPLGEGEVRELELALGVRFEQALTVVFVDGADQSPVEGAELRRSPSLVPQGEPTAWSTRAEVLARSDAEGRVVLDRSSLVGVEVQVDATGFGPVTFSPEQVADGAPFPLARAAELVLDVHTGEVPAAGWLARLRTPRSALSATASEVAGVVEWLAQTDELGRAHFGFLPAGAPLELELEDAGEVRHRSGRPWVLSAGEDGRASLDLGDGATLHGRLTDGEGAGLAGVELWLVPAAHRGPEYLDGDLAARSVAQRARTDDSGAYRFQGVAAGEWWVGPAPSVSRATADDVAPLGEWLAIPAEGEDLKLDLQGARGLFLAGVVRDAGRPRAGVEVVGQLSGQAALTRAKTDEQGRFRLGPLAPGRYEVAAVPDAAAGHSGSAAHVARTGEPEGSEELQLELLVGASLAVLALGEEGEPLEVAQVRWTRADGEPVFLGERTSALGLPHVDLAGLEAGRYAVGVVTTDGRIGERGAVELDPARGQQDVVVTVREAARLVLENDLPRPARVEVWSAAACSWFAREMHAGEEATVVVPHATVRVVVDGEAVSVEMEGRKTRTVALVEVVGGD